MDVVEDEDEDAAEEAAENDNVWRGGIKKGEK